MEISRRHSPLAGKKVQVTDKTMYTLSHSKPWIFLLEFWLSFQILHSSPYWYSKTRLKRPLKKTVFKTDNPITLKAPITNAADNICLIFRKNKVCYFMRILCQQAILMKYHALIYIKIPHGFQILILSIFEWHLKTGYTVFSICPAKLVVVLGFEGDGYIEITWIWNASL